MNGIIFFRTANLEQIKKFYIQKVGCRLWMDQGDCAILQSGNLLLGFCQREIADTNGMITFYFPAKEEVDKYYDKFMKCADSAPRDNPRYPIYHFFAKDPENRTLEFQYFYNLKSKK
jgi:hypothetical protein